MLHGKGLKHSFEVSLEQLWPSIEAHNPNINSDGLDQLLVGHVQLDDLPAEQEIDDAACASKHASIDVENCEIFSPGLNVLSTDLTSNERSCSLVKAEGNSVHHTANVDDDDHGCELLLA